MRYKKRHVSASTCTPLLAFKSQVALQALGLGSKVGIFSVLTDLKVAQVIRGCILCHVIAIWQYLLMDDCALLDGRKYLCVIKIIVTTTFHTMSVTELE